MAARMAKTPLAIAEAGTADAGILFVNDAFASLLESEAATWIGRPLGALSAAGPSPVVAGETKHFEVALDGGRRLPVALSIALVPGPAGDPVCLLCSLVDARGDGATQAIERDARMLAQVALAAGELMSEAAAAARLSAPEGDDAQAQWQAQAIAREALRRTVHPSPGGAA